MILTDWLGINQCSWSVLACVFLTFCYVGSLYVWRTTLSRDHPTTIKRRFFSVSVIMLITPFFIQYFSTEDTLKKGDLYMQLGLRWSGLIPAIIAPLFLTATLFLGPLTMQFLSGIWKIYAEPIYWLSSWQDLVWVRNHVMAPLSEEWVFRACMIPLLLQCVDPMTAVFVGPLLFGIAHFHHIFEQMKAGFELKAALMISTFQFMYTSLFGAYSAFLFVRTGHFMAPLVAHMFCNQRFTVHSFFRNQCLNGAMFYFVLQYSQCEMVSVHRPASYTSYAPHACRMTSSVRIACRHCRVRTVRISDRSCMSFYTN